MRKIASISFLILIFLTTLFVSGCDKNHYVKDGIKYFVEKDYYAIESFTISDEQKGVLIIPEEINGKPVYFGKDHKYKEKFLRMDTYQIKRIFIMASKPSDRRNASILTSGRQKIFYLWNFKTPIVGQQYYRAIGYFAYGGLSDYIPLNKYYFYANLSYQYNYDEAPNKGYYWIDDYDDELIEYRPQDPKREGYIFSGWYKEKECLNKWDFGNDKIPKKEYDADDNYLFKETKLYAKWQLAGEKQ